MKRSYLARTGATFVAAVMSVFFGFTGFAAANATITNTGPDSNNEITLSNSLKCEVNNENDIDIGNNTSQTAVSGNATVSHNTNVGSGWGAWDPAVWQNQGYTYEQWHSAFTAWMASQQSAWANNWGSLSAGGAITGNVSNSSTNNVSVDIDNNASGACFPNQDGTVTGSGSGGQDMAGGSVLGIASGVSTAKASGGAGGAGGFGSIDGFGAFMPGVSSTGMTNFPSVSGGAGSPGGAGGTGSGAGPVSNNAISNTGPDSNNQINLSSSTNVSVTNKNNVSTTNTTYQTSQSGDATVTDNTNAGGAGTGSSGNTSSSWTAATVVN